MEILTKFKANKLQYQYQFKIEILPEYVQRELFYTLPLLDQPKLLSINQKWRAIFLPFMWENIHFSLNQISSGKFRKLMKRYGHFIKFLDFYTNKDIVYPEYVYRNAKYMMASIDTLVHKGLFGLNAKLNEVIFDCRIGDLSLGEYIFVNEISLDYLLDGVKKLTINNIDDDFIENIIPFLPPSINQINIQWYRASIPFFEKLIARLPEIIHLKFITSFMPYHIFQSFQTLSLFKLQSLEIINHCATNNPIELSVDLMPQLTKLICTNLDIKFNKQLNLKEISMTEIDLTKVNLTKENVPNTRILKLEKIRDLSFKAIYNIFNLPKLTSLTIESQKLNNIMLLDEIYPKRPNHLLELNMINFHTDHSFYQFLFNYCHNLTHLSLGVSIIFRSQPFIGSFFKSNYITPKKLDLMYLNIFYHDEAWSSFLELVIANSPKLCVLKLHNTPETLSPKLVESKSLITN